MSAGGARSVAIALLAGAAVGLLILGIGGRIAMRIIARAAGQTPGFSVGGTLAVILSGALWGLSGGPVALGLEQHTRWPRLARGVVLGGIGFAVAMLTVGRQLDGPVTEPPLWPIAVAMCAALFLGYGILVAIVVGKTRERGNGKGETSPPPPVPG